MKITTNDICEALVAARSRATTRKQLSPSSRNRPKRPDGTGSLFRRVRGKNPDGTQFYRSLFDGNGEGYWTLRFKIYGKQHWVALGWMDRGRAETMASDIMERVKPLQCPRRGKALRQIEQIISIHNTTPSEV